MSIGDAALWAANALLDAAMVVWPAALGVTVLLAGIRKFTRHPSTWAWIFIAAIVTAVAFALAFGLAPILRSSPPFPFN